MSDEEVSFYVNCSGAKRRKKKIKKKEKIDVFIMYEKVIDFIKKDKFYIDENIKQKLNRLKNAIIPYGIDQDNFLYILKKYDINHVPIKEICFYDMKMEIEKIQEFEVKLDNYPFQEINFNRNCNSILEKARKILETPVKINFFNKQETNNNEKEMMNLKKQMVEVCKPFIYFFEKDEKEEQCSECGCYEMIEEEYCNICSNCGKIIDNIQTNTTFNDSERISFSQKYKYKKINHFKDTIRQFQGKQNKHIEPSVLSDLKKELEKDKIIDYSKSNPYYKLTKEHLRIYLDHTNHNKYYEDINLIYSHFTGKDCPIINDILYQKLLEDFMKLVQIFIELSSDKTDKIERTNFLNSQYVLYQLLKKNNYLCSENDFALPRSIKCRVDQEKIFIMLCEKLHWSYISIL